MKLSKMACRVFFVRAAAVALLAVPFAAIALLTGELYLRAKGRELTPPFESCFAADADFHYVYRPLCRSTSYGFNEDGFRDRLRAEFSKAPGTIAVLGDSVTEGFFLSAENTIPRQLEALLSNSGGFKFLNAGIRFTSPTLQFWQLQKKVEPHYLLRAVLLLLNGTDANDERLFQAVALSRDERGLPNKFLWFGSYSRLSSWIVELSQWGKGRSELINTVTRYAIFRIYLDKVKSVPPTPESLCPGIRRFAEELRDKNVPLLIAFTPHYREGYEGNWVGDTYHPEDLATMIKCAKETGAAIADLSSEEPRPEWFFPDKLHYTPAGTSWVAGKLRPYVEELLRAAPVRK